MKGQQLIKSVKQFLKLPPNKKKQILYDLKHLK